MALQDKSVIVIGGGIAGVTASLELADQGVKVTLVEQDDFIGGHAALLACKALESCQKCNGCLVEPRLLEILRRPDIRVLRRSRLVKVDGGEGGYRIKLIQQPAYIDPERCTACGLCLERCPEAVKGAIRKSPLAVDRPRLAINPSACLYFRDKKSTLCRDVCPEEAIRFDLSPEEISLEADSLVLASGFEPYAAEGKIRYGYGKVPDVITALELESQLRRDGVVSRPSDGGQPKRVAFIQCVGSREKIGNNYCSRVCCAYALRLGRMLRHRFEAEVSVFYMDEQSFGHALDDFLAAANEELELIRSMPGDLSAGPEGGVLVQYQAESGQAPLFREFDLVVLSIGLTPGLANPGLADLLKLELDEHGFVGSTAGPLAANRKGQPGIFLAGTIARPMDVAEVVAHAGRAAAETLSYLEGN